MAFLEIDHVTKYFASPSGNGRVCIFRDATIKIEKGEFVTVIGHSGCGKSTLLNIIAGLETMTEGGVILNGKEVTGPGLDRMVVFQNFSLMPWMTVFENIRLAVRAAYPDWDRKAIADHVRKYIALVGLSGAEDKRPMALSGGMKQRVGLARAFSIEPKVLLLDEPFAQIDALTRGVIQEELVQMWNTTRNTVFMVTHDVDEAILLSDRIMLMTNGPSARIAEIVDVTIPRP
ncbi:MAG: ABC transporter ATP-binding protein, partial [Nitrospirota bacterium]|nr:ABC transporter ATP-binding protein [Nitrospirota bacterium]